VVLELGDAGIPGRYSFRCPWTSTSTTRWISCTAR
jgi:hypothetical protein